MHRVFISYHHDNDQWYKEELVRFSKEYDIFEDWSVDTGDIDDNLPDQQIREIIRDEYLRESTVTILLVGTETKNRKHVDWELYSSMYNGSKNKKSGIIVINLPSTNNTLSHACHDGEKEYVFPNIQSWTSINTRQEYEERYPYMPERIIDNWLNGAKISAIAWDDLTVGKLKYMIEKAYEDKEYCDYDLSRPMRRRNS
jgi:hypothetical protein